MNAPEIIEKMIASAQVAVAPMLLLIVGWAVGYFSSYTKKKGENLATHEDLDKLVVQMKALTEAQKTIEAKISNDLWDRQKHWEMKREVLFEMARGIADANNALLALQAPLQMDEPESDKWTEARYQATTGWKTTSNRLDQTRTLVRVVCTKTTAEACDELAMFMNGLAVRLSNGTKETYKESQQELTVLVVMAKAHIRRELGVENMFKPQQPKS